MQPREPGREALGAAPGGQIEFIGGAVRWAQIIYVPIVGRPALVGAGSRAAFWAGAAAPELNINHIDRLGEGERLE